MTDSSSHLLVTADAYDAVAVLYDELFRDALAALPLDRALLAAFAELAGPPELVLSPNWAAVPGR
ncbi:hypothetical protein ACFV3R_31490 [Streptomyces sp. NPDC059740]|uniref:hypothetical protein n=1 Tax=Streptomyces sp. NPDC059740 TaxID=3346926 RepID=UPI0036682EA1